jgi:hypothetical protein
MPDFGLGGEEVVVDAELGKVAADQLQHGSTVRRRNSSSQSASGAAA